MTAANARGGAPEAVDLARYGWAPGDYTGGRCVSCGRVMADHTIHAYRCDLCAISAARADMARAQAPDAAPLPQHHPAPETPPTAILARKRAILGDMTTGEAEAWRRGYAAGERQAMEVLLPMLKAARAELAAARAELDAAPTGLEVRGG